MVWVHQQALIIMTDLTLGPPLHAPSVHFSRSSASAYAVSLWCAWAILYVYISSPVSCLDLGPIWLIVLSLVSNLSLAALDWIHHLPLSGTADRSCYQDPALVRYMGLEPCFCCSHLQLPAHPPLCSRPARAAPWHGKHLFSFLQKF